MCVAVRARVRVGNVLLLASSKNDTSTLTNAKTPAMLREHSKSVVTRAPQTSAAASAAACSHALEEAQKHAITNNLEPDCSWQQVPEAVSAHAMRITSFESLVRPKKRRQKTMGSSHILPCLKHVIKYNPAKKRHWRCRLATPGHLRGWLDGRRLRFKETCGGHCRL